MKVEVLTVPATQARIMGPEELSWHYIMDLIFAQSYQLKCQLLNLVIPDSPALRTMVELRRYSVDSLTQGGSPKALAWCVPGTSQVSNGQSDSSDCDYIFSLSSEPSNVSKLLSQYSIWTYKARMWGLGIRLTDSWNIAMRDRFMNQANENFVRPGYHPAHYHLYLREKAEPLA